MLLEGIQSVLSPKLLVVFFWKEDAIIRKTHVHLTNCADAKKKKVK